MHIDIAAVFRRMRRRYLTKIFSIIKRSLNVIKQYVMPDYKAPQSIYQMYSDEEIEKCFQHFKKYFKTSLFLDTWRLREHAIVKAIENDSSLEKTYIEFGVFSGSSINFLSKYLKQKTIYGFDSFEGLQEDWIGTSVTKGTFDLKAKIPKLNKNVIPVKGWIDKTLPKFLNEEDHKINFIHIDVDTYETTKFILEKIKPFLANRAIIIFDELYNFPGWDVGEYKALNEVFNENEYKFLSFAKNGQQAVIQLI